MESEEVLLIIVGILLSIFITVCIAISVAVLKLLTIVKRVVQKAEDVIDSVEAAAEVFKETQGRLTLFKLIRNIYQLVQKGQRKRK